MANPQDLIAQLMAAQQGGGPPGSQGMPMPLPPGIPGPPPPAPAPNGPPIQPPMQPPPGTRPAMTPPDVPTGGSSDEDMLDNVSNQMGGGTPPPTGGMKWVSLEDDQQALLNDPSPENVQAFVQYWGEDKLPEELQDKAQGQSEPDADADDQGD